MKVKIVVIFLGCLAFLSILFIACASSIPHAIEDKKDCISCHGLTGVKPYPNSHAKREEKNEDCVKCHKLNIETEEMQVSNK